MQRDSRQYADAARLLWDVAPERLGKLASGELSTTQSVRDAAQMALGVKREFLSPEEFGSQQAALDRLAGSLAMLPDFSLQEIAIATGHAPTRRTTPSATVIAGPKRSRTRVFRVALIVLVLLLGLEALARAGVSVPSPIEVIVDRLGGEPDPQETPGELRSRVDSDAAASRYETGALSMSVGAIRPSSAQSLRAAKTKHENHAQGRREHQAQGLSQHQAQGRDREKPDRVQGRRPARSRVERVAPRSLRKARATVAPHVDRGHRSRRWRRFR